MKVIGITGGIGSGKSTVAEIFKEYRISVYSSDFWAKHLMVTDMHLKNKLIELLGKEIYKQADRLDTNIISKKIFSSPDLLKKVNQLVHPAVAAHFKKWKKSQKGKFCLIESAILLESGDYKDCDYIIVVTAKKKLRMERAMKRDSCSKKDIQKRMDHQWSDTERIKLADFIINNDSDKTNLKLQVQKLIDILKDYR